MPRPQAAAAVIGTDVPASSTPSPAPITATAPAFIVNASPPTLESEPSATGDVRPTATPHPDLPATCAATPPDSAAIRALGYEHSICRSPLLSPDGRWLAFAQLTEARAGDELWIVDLPTGNQTRVSDPTWTQDAYRALELFEWSSTGQLLIIHNLDTGTAPASVFDPTTQQIVNLGGVSTLAWNSARTAVVGWEFRSGCLFTRVVGYVFSTGRLLRSAAPDEEIVGRVFWLPDDGGFVYSRREIVGECPACYYKAAELVQADLTERIYTTLLSDPGLDFILLGFQDRRVALAERPYQYHTCEAPELSPTDTTYYLLDPSTRELTAIEAP